MFEKTALENSFNKIEKTEKNNLSEMNLFEVEADFAEQYKDSDGILHLKTMFEHSETEGSEIWEVFNVEDGATPLELLLEV